MARIVIQLHEQRSGYTDGQVEELEEQIQEALDAYDVNYADVFFEG